MTMNQHRLSTIIIALFSVFCLLASLGCTPVTVSFTLGEKHALKPALVMGDKGAQSKIALIQVRGLISDTPKPGLISSSPSVIHQIVARLRQAEHDPSVKAVILRINSPGGTVAGSETLYHELQHFRQTTNKPIVASMGEVAASGGYYIALAADRIIVQPTTLTASIGVIFPTINVSKGLNKLGIHSRAVTSGPNKDMGNPLEPMNDAHYALIQQIVDEFYTSFKELVIQRRPNLPKAMQDLATDGRIMTGVQAHELKLVDDLGTLRDAFAIAKDLADLTSAQLVSYTATPAKSRTAYEQSELAVPSSSVEMNLLKIDALSSWNQLSTPGAYYLWLPPTP